jgi:acyl-coenzyme A thioesterase PaaI-like protein
LRIFPGAVGASGLIAAPWIPHESLTNGSGTILSAFLWSALDCTSAFAVMPDKKGIAIVLGELTADLTGAVTAGEPCVVVAWPLGVEGRKRHAGSAVYAPRDRLVAAARAVWIEVPLSSWA